MRFALALLLAASAAGCSRKAAGSYKNCLKLRLGMTQEQLFAQMGEPDETIPFVEGKSLEHLRGRTAYEWANPASMPGPNYVSVSDASRKVESVRCSDVVITAEVFVEPPEPPSAPARTQEPPAESPPAPARP